MSAFTNPCYDIPALVAEANRRLDDPARPPMDLRDEPLTPEETHSLLTGFRTMSYDHQQRLLDILEWIDSLPEPKRTREIERQYIIFGVVMEAA